MSRPIPRSQQLPRPHVPRPRSTAQIIDDGHRTADECTRLARPGASRPMEASGSTWLRELDDVAVRVAVARRTTPWLCSRLVYELGACGDGSRVGSVEVVDTKRDLCRRRRVAAGR